MICNIIDSRNHRSISEARRWIGAQQLLERQPEVAIEIGMSMDALTRELMGLVRRARTVRECVHVARTITNAFRETADEFDAIEAKARSSRS